MSAVKKAVAARATIASSVAALREELSQLEAKCAELVERREQIEAAPIDRETAEAAVSDLVAALASKVVLPAHWLSQPNGYSRTKVEQIPSSVAPFQGAGSRSLPMSGDYHYSARFGSVLSVFNDLTETAPSS